MTQFHATTAKTQKELNQITDVRWKVFDGFIRRSFHARPMARREVVGMDLLETTIHFGVHFKDQTIGAARLLLPNPEVASEHGYTLGVSLEQQYEIVCGLGLGVLAAEVSRLCILEPWRGTRALPTLFGAVIQEAQDWGITHVLGTTNLETRSPEDAAVAYGVACHLGLTSKEWTLKPRKPMASAPLRRPSLYTLSQRVQALRGDHSELTLPPTLSLMVRLVGAKVAGEPAYDPYMRMFAMPIVVDLDAISSTPMRKFMPPKRRRRSRRSATSITASQK